MNIEHVNAIIAFLQRTQLSGSEAGALVECVQVLQKEAERLQREHNDKV